MPPITWLQAMWHMPLPLTSPLRPALKLKNSQAVQKALSSMWSWESIM